MKDLNPQGRKPDHQHRSWSCESVKLGTDLVHTHGKTDHILVFGKKQLLEGRKTNPGYQSKNYGEQSGEKGGSENLFAQNGQKRVVWGFFFFLPQGKGSIGGVDTWPTLLEEEGSGAPTGVGHGRKMARGRFRTGMRDMANRKRPP